MKLYTEEQVNQIIDRAYDLELGTDEQMTGYLMMNITPIELPSDEEIRIGWRIQRGINTFDAGFKLFFEMGAKWMKEQILNQNK